MVRQLFTNTKSNLGPYDKIIDDKMKAEFQALPQEEKDKYGFCLARTPRFYTTPTGREVHVCTVVVCRWLHNCLSRPPHRWQVRVRIA